MGLFSKESKEKNFLGIDIGGSSVKLVELKALQGRPLLVTYGYLERSTKSTKESLLDRPDDMAQAIKRVAEKAKTHSKDATTALPASAVFTTVLKLTDITEKDLSSIKKVTASIEAEAKKVLPLPVEEMVLDWKVLKIPKKNVDGETVQKDRSVEVLLTAASKEVVKKYIEIFKKAGLNLLSLETESFAMTRALLGKDSSPIIIVDMGAANTDITLVDNGLPYFERTVDVGGYNITKNLSDTMGISLDQAEQFKRDLGSYKDKLPEGKLLPPSIEKVLAPVINEVKYIMQFFSQQPGNEDKKIDRIILSGGTARLFNAAEYFTQVFNIRAFPGDPWARLVYPEELKPVLDNIGSRLAVSIGLAMREIEKGTKLSDKK